MFLVQRNTQNSRCFMLTCENEQFHLLGPLPKSVSEICRQDECISVMEKHICLILYFARQHTPNANMAAHSVVARDELHESEVSWSSNVLF